MRSNHPMSLDQIRNAAPAVFATDRNTDRTSDLYQFVSTEKVLTAMLDAGYGVSRAQQKHTRLLEDMTSTRHLLAFRPKEAFSEQTIGDAIPEVLMINAHDGLTRYKLILGLFRMVCTNGLIVGQTFESVDVVHRGDAVKQVVDGTAKILEWAPRLNTAITDMTKRTLSPVEMDNFAEEAMAIRYGENRPFEPKRLLELRRPEDKGNDLWHVFNRAQEGLMRGGIEGHTATGRRSVSRPIERVTKDVTYNQRLWDLSNEYLKAA